MADTPQYFKSPDTFTLIIGQERTKLHVPRPLFEQIPFFSNALKGDHYREAKEKTFEMPEDDPKAVNDFLHFVFADHVKPLEETSKDSAKEDETGIVKAYLKAYIVADKFMAERTANRIADCLFDYYQTENVVHLDLLGMLTSAGLHESQLHEFLVCDVASVMKKAAKEEKQFRPQCSGTCLDDNYLFDQLSRDDAVALLRALSFPDSTEDFWKKCHLHTYNITPACSDSSSGGSDDGIEE